MNIKKVMFSFVSAAALFTAFNGFYANASKWHKGLPSFLINTKWESDTIKAKYHNEGTKSHDNDYNIDAVYKFSFNKNDSTLISEQKMIGKASKVATEKDKSISNNYKYREVSKNLYKLAYHVKSKYYQNYDARSTFYKISNNNLDWVLSPQESVTYLSGNKAHLNKVN